MAAISGKTGKVGGRAGEDALSGAFQGAKNERGSPTCLG